MAATIAMKAVLRLPKWLTWLITLPVGIWVLTLGIFVEESLDFSYQDKQKVSKEIGTAVQVTRTGVRRDGVPYLFHKTTDIGPFGVVALVSSSSAISELKIEQVVVHGIAHEHPLKNVYSYQNRNFFAELPAVIPEQGKYRVSVVGSLTKGGELVAFRTSHVLNVELESRWGIGWLMLVYYSQF